MHENGNDVNHNLSDNNVYSNEQTKSHEEPIVSNKIFHRFKTEKDGLFIDYKTIQEYNTTSK
jgi:hypothetical protein